MEIDQKLAEKLIAEQFPEWAHLPVYPVEKSGHDNRTFHLGNDMSIRLPSGEAYAQQIEKESTWLPFLQNSLSYPISCPVAKGRPSQLFPYPWSVNRWLKGDTADNVRIENKKQFAEDLAYFLRELQAVDASQGPKAGKHNFYRGGPLLIYDAETKETLKEGKEILPVEKLSHIWSRALSSRWQKPAVWVHGDIAPGNLLVENGRLSGLIDFGIVGTGDPACDYAIAWTFMDRQSRELFYSRSGCDEDTWNRAKGWALWKALITYRSDNKEVSGNAKDTIGSLLEEEAYSK